MIELNLLPKNLRRKKKKMDMPVIPILPVAFAVLAVVIVLQLVMIFWIRGKSVALHKLNRKFEELKPQSKTADDVAKEIQDMENRMAAMKSISKPPLDWAELMAGLNLAVVPDVWLSEFKPVAAQGKGQKGPGTLELTGYALGESEVATSTVAKFIDSLKNTNEFFKYFEEVELQDVRQQTMEKESVMAFKLIARFKTAAEPVKQEAQKTGPAKQKDKKAETAAQNVKKDETQKW